MEKLIITAALTGAEVTRDHTPYLPLTPEEIADEAYRCWEAGASIAHIHVRDEQGRPTQDKEIFAKTMQLIKERCDIIIQPTTGGAVTDTPEQRIQPVTLAPELATLTMGTVNFGDDVFMNRPKDIEHFAETMLQYGTKPELEIFEAGMITNALVLEKKGLLKGPLHFDFVMGVPGAIAATADNLLHLVRMIPEGATWTVSGIGRHQLPMNTLGIVLGGHVRVGFEDNIYYEKGVKATSNAQFVERIVRIARELGREVANRDETRKILGLPL